MALARWCGGPDNATLIAAHVPDIRTTTVMEGILQFWDAFSMLQVIYSKQNSPPIVHQLPPKVETSLALRDDPANLRGGDAKVGIKAKRPRRKSKVDQQEVVQFSIDVEGPRKEGEKNADR